MSALNDLIAFFKKHFLTRKFLVFCVIGVVNTVIDTLVYLLFYDKITPGIVYASRGAAFIVASVFSYFANAFFTFKPESRNGTQFAVVMLVFLIRMLLTIGLAEIIDYVVVDLIGIDYQIYPIAKSVTPILSSAIMIPIAYFVLDAVFRRYGRKPE
jgi:putative flippase GtrA